jgi:hypothetical protein
MQGPWHDALGWLNALVGQVIRLSHRDLEHARSTPLAEVFIVLRNAIGVAIRYKTATIPKGRSRVPIMWMAANRTVSRCGG